MSDNHLKVTDRRMFTADGELRQAFQHLDHEPAEQAVDSGNTVFSEDAVDSSSESASTHQPLRPSAEAPSPAAEQTADLEQMVGVEALEPEDLAEDGAPSFLDLVSLLAEHASIYIMQSRTAPPAEASENLEVARLHIDLLEVLKQKTQGNLASNEQALLDDAIGQLRAGFVGLQG